MLNQDTITQLRGLKAKIEASKEYADATVKATRKRFGFAVLDDGREVFLPPEEMSRVLPGDRVHICIQPTRPRKSSEPARNTASIERLIHTKLGKFVGTVVQKDKTFFVEPDLPITPKFKRWLFIPPKYRRQIRAGDLIQCELLQHPVKDGKASVSVLLRLGRRGESGTENRYCGAKAGLKFDWSASDLAKIGDAPKLHKPLEEIERADLTHLDFVSIDSAKTQDIDDALCAEVTNEGWRLYVAIADPTAWLRSQEELSEILIQRASSHYFHGDIIPLLPENFVQDHCALVANSVRPAIVCSINIKDSGEITGYEVQLGIIRSRAKLTYSLVDRYITKHDQTLIEFSHPLESLLQIYRALRGHRETRELVMEDRSEFRWILDKHQQISSIEKHEKLQSQRLVEECMVAANRCVADYLLVHQLKGPFVTHQGFRSDRHAEAREFLKRHQTGLEDKLFTEISGYREVFACLSRQKEGPPLRAMINRLLSRAEFSKVPAVHMGMALPAYTTFTSPLRKAFDYLVHLEVGAHLRNETAIAVDDDLLITLNQSIAKGRFAVQSADYWLATNYLEQQRSAGHSSFEARISHISSAGFTIKLDINGLEGLVDLRPDPEKFSFDIWHMRLTSKSRTFQLGEKVNANFISAGIELGSPPIFALHADAGKSASKSLNISQTQINRGTQRSTT